MPTDTTTLQSGPAALAAVLADVQQQPQPTGARLRAFHGRVQPGTRLLCIANEYRPVVDGTIRLVKRNVGRRLAAVLEDDPGQELNWLEWPNRVKDVRALTDDVIVWHMLSRCTHGCSGSRRPGASAAVDPDRHPCRSGGPHDWQEKLIAFRILDGAR